MCLQLESQMEEDVAVEEKNMMMTNKIQLVACTSRLQTAEPCSCSAKSGDENPTSDQGGLLMTQRTYVLVMFFQRWHLKDARKPQVPSWHQLLLFANAEVAWRGHSPKFQAVRVLS